MGIHINGNLEEICDTKAPKWDPIYLRAYCIYRGVLEFDAPLRRYKPTTISSVFPQQTPHPVWDIFFQTR